MPLPTGVTAIPVHDLYVDDDGVPMAGKVSFSPSTPVLQVPGAATSLALQSVTVDVSATGEMDATLIANDDADITPVGWYWTVKERFPKLTRDRIITVPAATVGTLELATIADSIPTPSVTAYALQSAFAALGLNVVLLDPGDDPNEATMPEGSPSFLRVLLPNSPADENADTIVMLYEDEVGNLVKTGYFNGNGELRSAPSRWNRVAARIFEWAESLGQGHVGNTGDIFQVSTNPTIAANREALFAVRGTEHADAGWVVASRHIDAPNIGAKLTAATSAPSSPREGDVWIDTT